MLSWAYTVAPQVISAYESIEQVENGLWDDEDESLIELEELLDEINSSEDDEEEDGEDDIEPIS